MLKENVGNARISPNKSDNLQLEELKRELDHLKNELENGKIKLQESRKKYNSELKRCKETAERDKRKLLDNSKSKWEQQKIHELQQLKDAVLREREVEIRQLLRWKDEELKELQASLERERDVAVRQARDLQKQLVDELLSKGFVGKSSPIKKEDSSSSGGDCQCKLQDILSKVRWEYDGEQASCIRHLRKELDVERSLFLKYILANSKSNYSAILNRKPNSSNCGRVKYGRHSLGSAVSRAWSVEETSQPGTPESLDTRRWSEEITSSETGIADCLLPQTSSPQSPAEQGWYKYSDNEPLEACSLRFQEDTFSEMSISLTGANSDITSWRSSSNEMHQLHLKTDDEKQESYGMENRICNHPQSFGTLESDTDTLQQWSLMASIMSRARDGSDEPWVLEEAARCSLLRKPLSTGAVQSQENDSASPKELPSHVFRRVMAHSPPELDVEPPVVQVLQCAHPVNHLTDIGDSGLAFKLSMLSRRDLLVDPTSSPVDIPKDITWVEEHAGDLPAVPASFELPVTKLSRTKLQGIKCVSVPTDNQEVPVCPQENEIRSHTAEQLLKTLHAVCEQDDKCVAINTNGSDPPQSKQDAELLNTLQVLEQRYNDLKAENILLRKNIFPETEEKVKRLKRKNAELAVVAKRLEERAQRLQEANLKMVNTPIHLKGTNLELCKKAFARQRARDMSEQASALLAKDKQIETLKQECHQLQAKLSAGKDFPTGLKLNDLDRLLHESQKEVLRLQRQIAVKHLKDSLHASSSDSHVSPPRPSPPLPDAVYVETLNGSDEPMECGDKSMRTTSGDVMKVAEFTELTKKRKECEILEQEVKKKHKRCEELEIKLQEVQAENARLVEENSRLSNKVKWTGKVDAENADLRVHLNEVIQQRDSALKESHQLQSKLENLEQVLKHMRDVVERRQQLEKDHEDALISLKTRQEEVKRLQLAQVEAKKEHEGAVQLLENTLDNLQAKVKLLEEKCRSQTEQFSLLSQELERFRLQTGNIDLLTSTLVTHELPPPQCCSTPELPQDERGAHSFDEFSSWDVISWVDISLDDSSCSFIYLSMEGPGVPNLQEKNREGESKKEKKLPRPPSPSYEVGSAEAQNNASAKEKRKTGTPNASSKSESAHESSKSCPTPEVDTASEMEDLEADSVSLNPEPEARAPAKLQVFLARYSYNPFDGPNENPEAELPLTAGEYIYIYGDMDDDGFFEGELMDGRRGLVPSNFVDRVSDDGLMAFQPAETHDLSQSSLQDISFLSGSSIERSEEDDDDESSLSQLPCPLQGNSEGTANVSAVPYPRKLTLIKQLARSMVVGWEPPLVTAGSANILSYNIYVDNELRQNVRCGGQTKALIEKLELKTRSYRISVQSMTERGCSDRTRCTLLVGHGYSLAPTQLRVRNLSATSAEITWQPCNSNYSHALYLNEEPYGVAKAGTYWYNFSSLRPSTLYNVKVEARPQRIPFELPLERREQKTTVMQLTTPAAGPPDAPLDVQVELGPTPGVLLISWLPVTIDAAGTSNGVRVTGYAVYADGQKVLEVTSPTAGSVLVGMSHLQLLQVSREISVRTMSPSGESVDSVPAQIPAALLKVPNYSSPLHNSSLICEPASGQLLDSSPEKVSSTPLTSSSPCSLPTPPATSSKASFSIHTSCSRGEALDFLPVRISSQLLHSPPCASVACCQVSSSAEPSETLVPQQAATEDPPVIGPHTESNPIPTSLPILAWATDSATKIPSNQSQERGNSLERESIGKTSDTKESPLNVQSPSLDPGHAWNKEAGTEECKAAAKEDCSSPETAMSEEAEDPRCSVGYRGVSIEDFLEEKVKAAQSDGTNYIKEVEEEYLSLPEAHAVVSHIDHSRSSNLSDILEEEEEEEEEQDEDDPNAIAFVKKWGEAGVSAGGDGLGKLDSCETDSDEEFLERMLDLPLQKHCSKKLFIIPEVTEEEDEEEEENFTPTMATKNQTGLGVETQSHQLTKSPKIFLKKPVAESSENLSTGIRRRENLVRNTTTKRVEEDCVLLDEDWYLKTKAPVTQPQLNSLKPAVLGSSALNSRKSSTLNDRAYHSTESNKRRVNDAREHCSRLATNPIQTATYGSKCYSLKDHGTVSNIRETPQNNHKSCKGKPQIGSLKRKTKPSGACNSRHLEIDIEYDTEDEEEPPFSALNVSQTKTNHWEECSQADQDRWSDGPSQPEPTKHMRRRKELKRQFKVQTNSGEYSRESIPLLHGGDCQRTKRDSWTDDKLLSNNAVRTAHLDCHGKDDWNGNSRSSLTGLTEVPASVKKNRSSQLPPDKESAADRCASPEFCRTSSPREDESSSKHQDLETVRIFVARFDYDPETMSPNPDAYEEELPFKEGQILQVFGDKDADGFYWGEYAGKSGYIPCNMVSELHVQNEDMKLELVRQGSFKSLSNDMGELIFSVFIPLSVIFSKCVHILFGNLSVLCIIFCTVHSEIRAFSPPSSPLPCPCPSGRLPPPKPRRSKKVQLTAAAVDEQSTPEKRRIDKCDFSSARPMVAIFDYNPKESSPNMDVEAELSFNAGDVITVYGQMDEDGFYYGELNGQRGLVPSNFLEASHTEAEKARSQEPVHVTGEMKFSFDVSTDQPDSPPEDYICNQADDFKLACETSDPHQGVISSKKKKSFFSKGRKLFKKLGSSGKNV
ncbi:peripheral-type benzodiazepine receptor-associated protein 1 [Spea bombifrons]|uniref:peripheral-type benzodiazepine receptor-associated protein 1 n=1 Tax=Spea bombifrons TaxID=233779 RepID=UPI00234BAE08|nr:peripheral-type benzodiazepine receptor-associated protein 1 [Spea bombifrons]